MTAAQVITSEPSIPSTSTTLPEMYRQLVATSIDETGIEVPHGLMRNDRGEITMVALAVPTPQAYAVMLKLWERDRPAEMIFALDRFTRAGQGTTHRDLMAGHHFVGPVSRPFIIEYQHEPRIVEPIDWCNRLWNEALTRELAQSLAALR